jgi:hypothetical protein
MPIPWRRALLLLITLATVGLGVAAACFPGPRLAMAVTLGTGWEMGALQARVDALEDRAFLVDLYRTMATGGRWSGVLAQTGKLMDHYLDGSGEDLVLEPQIFTGSRRVQSRMTTLRERAQTRGCTSPHTQTTEPFHMPDPGHLDSFFGLYHGTLTLTSRPTDEGRCLLEWSAEVPWTWPTYEVLEARYGDPREERHGLPNLTSLFRGPSHALHIGNGLGGHLATLGLARPFVAHGSWRETTP